MRPEAKVGLIIFSAIIAIVVVYWFLGGLALTASSYPLYADFHNIQILDTGAAVRMAGVRIGVVDEIHLTGERMARVRMRIKKGYNVPLGSKATVTTGGLIGQPYVEISPGPGPEAYKPGDTVTSRELAQLDDLLAQVGTLMTSVQGTTNNLNKIIGDPEFVANTKDMMRDLRLAAASAVATADSVRGIVDQNGPELNAVLSNLDDASRNVVAITDQLNNALANGGTAQVHDILANAERASASLANASAGVEKITANPQLAQDVAATAANAREIAERTNRLLTQFENLTGRISKKKGSIITKPTGLPIRSEGLNFDLFENASEGKLRADVNFDFRIPGLFGRAPNASNFYRVGLFDLGEDTRLNAQFGKRLDNGDSFRYGLYASRLGIGYDWWPVSDTSVHADLYDLNDPTLEIKALRDINPKWGLWLGVNDALDDPDVLVGARYKW